MASAEPSPQGAGNDAGSGAPGGAPGPASTPDPWQSALSQVDADIRNDPSMKEVNSVPAALKSYVNAQRLLAKNSVGIPGEKASEAEWQSFYAKLGRPEKAEGYQQALADWKPPDGLPWQADLVPKMLEKFHAAGLSPKQARSLVEGYAGLQGEAFQAMTEAADARAAEVEQQLGAKYGERYDAAKDLAMRAFKDVFGESFGEVAELRLADGVKLGDHPALFDAFVKIGESLQNHAIVGDKSREIGLSAGQAQQQIDSIMGDKKHAYFDRDNPGHARAVAQVTRLFQIVGASASKGEE